MSYVMVYFLGKMDVVCLSLYVRASFLRHLNIFPFAFLFSFKNDKMKVKCIFLQKNVW